MRTPTRFFLLLLVGFFPAITGTSAAAAVETLFLCHFDKGVEPDYAFGSGYPAIWKGNISDGEGRFGGGVRNDGVGKGMLGYSGQDGNIDWNEGTLEFWLNPDWDGRDSGTHYFFVAGDVLAHDFMEMFYSGGNLRFRYYDTDWRLGQACGRVDGQAGSPLLKKGRWSHVAFTWRMKPAAADGSNRTELGIFLDGRKISPGDLYLTQRNVGLIQRIPSVFYIGTGHSTEYGKPRALNTAYNLGGMMDELRISPRAKTDFSHREKPIPNPDPEKNLQDALTLAKSKNPPGWSLKGLDLDALGHYTIDPKLYDLWSGKKTRMYLTGLWKLRKLSGPEATAEERANDRGTRQGYYRPDYDDSRWDLFPVPWTWKQPFNRRGESVYPLPPPTSVGWYRRDFSLDSLPSKTRLILHFEHVSHQAKVYLNGNFIGEHANLLPYRGEGAPTLERFDFDVTDNVRVGRNVLAIKVGEIFPDPGSGGGGIYGGIWQPVWIDLVGEVHCRQVLFTYSMKNDQTTVRSFLTNTTGKTVTFDVSAEIKPWVSDRYKMPGGTVMRVALGTWRIPPGQSERTFALKIDRPVRWDPETPFLYHFIMRGTSREEKSVVLGQERFALREFRTDRQYFRLNGKKAYLAGECTSAFGPTQSGTDGACNAGHQLEWGLRHYKEANVGFLRSHSSRNCEVFYDLCDEMGFLLTDELPQSAVDRVLASNKVDDQMRQWMEHRYFANYNHPAIVLCSMGNEIWDGGGVNNQPALDALLDCARAFDPTRPMVGSSGRFLGMYGPKTKNDYEDFHSYVGLVWGNWLTFEETTKAYWTNMVSTYGTKVVPMMNNECLGFHRHSTYVPMLPAIKGNGEYDRKLYADLVPANIAKSGWIGEAGNLFLYTNMGLEEICDDTLFQAARARMHKRSLEGARRQGDIMAGYGAYHTLQVDGGLFSADFKPGPTYRAIQTVNAPLFAGLDWFNLHRWAGDPVATKLFVINDTYHDVKPVTITGKILPRGGENVLCHVEIPVGAIGQGDRRVIKFNLPLPESLPTGWYTIGLEAWEGNQLRHWNEYDVFVQNRSNFPIGVKCAKRVALYPGKGPTKRILDELKVPYAAIDDFSHLADFDVLILGAASLDQTVTSNGEKIRAWLTSGKRLVQLEQSKLGVLPWLSELRLVGAGISYAEPMTYKHPVFAGLDREQMRAWNDGINVVDAFYTPVGECLLAGCGMSLGWFGAGSVGMSVLEPRVGKGVAFVSQVEAVRRFDSDPVARKYMVNLLRYTLEGPWTDYWAGRLGGTRQRVRTEPITESRCFFVNLRAHVNMEFRDENEGDRKGGWTDQGSQDLRHFPTGRQVMDGVPFDIITPPDNHDKSIIVLRGTAKPYFPQGVRGIAVKHKAKRLFFLYSAAWVGTADKKETARFIVHFGGGNVSLGTINIPLICGVNVGDWWGGNFDLPEANVVWHQVHPVFQHGTAVYMFEWKNPQPEGTITQIDFVKAREDETIPILLAVTGEE
jgi:beta-galactosidase